MSTPTDRGNRTSLLVLKQRGGLVSLKQDGSPRPSSPVAVPAPLLEHETEQL